MYFELPNINNVVDQDDDEDDRKLTNPPPQVLKTMHDTSKYAIIYHTQLVGQAGTKLKGKVRSSIRLSLVPARLNTRHDTCHVLHVLCCMSCVSYVVSAGSHLQDRGGVSEQ